MSLHAENCAVCHGLHGEGPVGWWPLSDYHVDENEMAQFGDWNAAKDCVVNLGLASLAPFTTEPELALFERIGTLADSATRKLHQALRFQEYLLS
jgi:hypothetical protein